MDNRKKQSVLCLSTRTRSCWRNELQIDILSPLRRFRALVRMVIANMPWLVEADNIKTGTILYTLKKALQSNFTIEHKAILNKQHEDRTEEENTQIYKIISRCKGFRKYPDNVKMLLASYSYFQYFGPDRVIVRKNQYATAIFFIISGEVSVIEEVYDSFLDEYERNVTQVLTVGDIFGEICLLHDLPRGETIISSSSVEFLMLKRADFDIVLKATVKMEWDYISSLMKSFNYFKDWNEVRIGECCMQSLIKTFPKGETILGDGIGKQNYVHFVFEGQCSLVEHIQIIEVTKPNGFKNYSLYSGPAGSAQSVAQSQSASLNRIQSLQNKIKSRSHIRMANVPRADSNVNDIHDDGTTFRKNSLRHSMEENEGKRSSSYTTNELRRSLFGVPKGVETVFVQVCVFREKACFSLGESMLKRRIVADRTVRCLLIPRYLLLGHDNIWLRIKQILTKRIPTPEAVFESLVRQRKWRQYKKDLVKPLLSPYCTNWFGNVPFSIRIQSDFDFKRVPIEAISSWRDSA